MHYEIDNLKTKKNIREKIEQVYNWFESKIIAEGGSYKVPQLVKIANEHFNISDKTLAKYLKKLVSLGLLIADKTCSRWRFATYKLPEAGTEVAETFKVEQIPSVSSFEIEILDVNVVSYVKTNSLIIRNERVLLDFDLAKVYGVETRRLNEQRERNPERFPADFAFQLNDDEMTNVISQNAIFESKKFTHEPWAYTLEGCNMASAVLNTEKAVKRSVQIHRTFSDLERMAHSEKPKQSGFVELMQMIAEQNKMVTANIMQLTAGISTISTDLNSRKADKIVVEEIKYIAKEANRKAAEVDIKVDDVTSKVDNLINQEVINNRQMIIDKYRHIVTWLRYWEMGYDYQKNEEEFGDVSRSLCWKIKHDYGLPDSLPVTQIPSHLQEQVIQDLRKSVFSRLERRQLKDFYRLKEEYQKFLISQGFPILPSFEK